MIIQQKILTDPADELDTVVVIDVLRAFSVAGFAFSRGVKEIYIVRTVDEAFHLRDALPGSFISGEVDGVMVPGFDYGNSPADFVAAELEDRVMIQRTTAGTQGLVRYRAARNVFAVSFVCAQATAEAVLALKPESVTFVVTGKREGVDGDEDIACADYMSSILNGQRPNPLPYLLRVGNSSWGRQFGDADKPHFPREDLALCGALDRFPHAMRLECRGEHSVLVRA